MLLMNLLNVLDCDMLTVVDRKGDDFREHICARWDDRARIADIIDRHGARSVEFARVGQYAVYIQLAPEAAP